MNNKRGLSGIVTIVIIILLVLAAVAIVWSTVRPSLEDAGEQIQAGTQCLNLDLEVTGCTNADAVTIRRGSGGSNVDFTGIRVATGSGSCDWNEVLDALGTVTITLNETNCGTGNAIDLDGSTIFNIGGIQEGGDICPAVDNPQTVVCT